MNGASGPVLELHGVCKAFHRRSITGNSVPVKAVDGVSLSLARAEILGLVGESGAGKSTIGRVVLGLERPDIGEVLFDGLDLAKMSWRRLRQVRRRMHMILQDPYESLHPAMRLVRIVGEPLVIAGVPRSEIATRVASALDEVGLVPPAGFLRRYPSELSGGQRQRVAIARALVGGPELVVADEPTSMLDASLRAGVLELILAMRDRLGTAFIFITHDLAVARYVSDRIAVMHEGRLVEIGPTDTLIAAPQDDYTRTLLAASEGVL